MNKVEGTVQGNPLAPLAVIWGSLATWQVVVIVTLLIFAFTIGTYERNKKRKEFGKPLWQLFIPYIRFGKYLDFKLMGIAFGLFIVLIVIIQLL